MIIRKHPFLPLVTGALVAAQAAFAPAIFAQVGKSSPPAEKPAAKEEPIQFKDPVAIVNGEKITASQLNDALSAAAAEQGIKISDIPTDRKLEVYRGILESLILEKLITEASAGKVSPKDVDAELAKAKAEFPSEEQFNAQLKSSGLTPEKLNHIITQQLWVKQQIAGKADVTEEEAKAFYDQNKEKFEQPETVKASHILIQVDKDASADVVKQKLETAKKAAARVKKGEDFAVVAKEVSEEPAAKQSGGDLGYFSKQRMVPEFAEAAFKQKVGEVGEPVRTDYGWHVIKVTDTKPAGMLAYPEVQEQIKAYLQEEKEGKAVQDVIKNLRNSAKIQNNLPPPAQGVPVSKEN